MHTPFPLSLSLSFSLCVAFNQLLTLTSLARRSTRLFSLLSLAFYLRAPLSMTLFLSPSPVLCLSWLPQWLSEPQSVTVSLSGWDFPLCCQSPLLRLCLPCGKANVKVDSALPAACCLLSLSGPVAAFCCDFALHSKWIIIELSLASLNPKLATQGRQRKARKAEGSMLRYTV